MHFSAIGSQKEKILSEELHDLFDQIEILIDWQVQEVIGFLNKLRNLTYHLLLSHSFPFISFSFSYANSLIIYKFFFVPKIFIFCPEKMLTCALSNTFRTQRNHSLKRFSCLTWQLIVFSYANFSNIYLMKLLTIADKRVLDILQSILSFLAVFF